ncbi:MAG: nucleotidyltransferase family protein [Planctomycetota bacterium]
MAHITVDREKIAAFCRKWGIKELSLFGSVLRNDFRPDSDVDVLVVYDAEAKRNLHAYVQAVAELEQLFDREVDLVEKSALRNPFRRQHILNNREVIYAP